MSEWVACFGGGEETIPHFFVHKWANNTVPKVYRLVFLNSLSIHFFLTAIKMTGIHAGFKHVCSSLAMFDTWQ